MNEEVSNKSVNLAVTMTKLSGRALYTALCKYMNDRKMNRGKDDSKEKVGKQKLKDLMRDSTGQITSMDIADQGIRDFEKIAKKYGVGFSIIHDKNEDPPKYIVFFKAKDKDVMTQVLADYAKKQMGKSKSSILEKLKEMKEIVKKLAPLSKDKKREMVR